MKSEKLHVDAAGLGLTHHYARFAKWVLVFWLGRVVLLEIGLTMPAGLTVVLVLPWIFIGCVAALLLSPRAAILLCPFALLLIEVTDIRLGLVERQLFGLTSATASQTAVLVAVDLFLTFVVYLLVRSAVRVIRISRKGQPKLNESEDIPGIR